MSDKKQLQDEETEKVDGGVNPGKSGFPSPAKVTPKLPDPTEEKTGTVKKTDGMEQCHD